jgi:protein-S-isoprenylcysteine O-methyltransferase Ste14
MMQRIMPTAYLALFLILSIGLYLILPIIKFINPPYHYLGCLLILFGVIINIWTDILLKKYNTTVKPYLMPASLITSGPFRISRHPMYAGMTAILLGVAIVQGALSGFVFPIIFVVLMELLFVSTEEKNLARAFGPRYLEYKKKVRRWL